MSNLSIIQKLSNWLQKPTPNIGNTVRDKWISVTFTAGFAFIFLLVFQPFGVNNYDPTHRINNQLLFGVGAITSLTGLIMAANEFIIQRLFFKLENRAQIIVWMLWSLLLIGSAVFLFYNLLGNFHDWSWGSYFGFLRDVTNMMLLPMIMIYFFFHYREIKHQHRVISNKLSLPKDFLHFKSENQKEALVIQINQLLYLEAQENYVAIYYLKDEVIKKDLLRSSLKRLESQFPTVLLRCHRSYIVNLNAISQIRVKYREVTLMLFDGKIEIPVSRKYQNRVKSKVDIVHSSPRVPNHP